WSSPLPVRHRKHPGGDTLKLTLLIRNRVPVGATFRWHKPKNKPASVNRIAKSINIPLASVAILETSVQSRVCKRVLPVRSVNVRGYLDVVVGLNATRRK